MISKLGNSNMNFAQLQVSGKQLVAPNIVAKTREGEEKVKQSECAQNEPVHVYARNYSNLSNPNKDYLVVFPERMGAEHFLTLRNPEITAGGKKVDLSDIDHSGTAIHPNGTKEKL